MSDKERDRTPGVADVADESPGEAIAGYAVGLALAAGLTVASFAVAHTPLIYGPAIPMALIVLAIAQIGVHLVFFLHLTSGPDNTNNMLALLFGTMVVFLLIAGSVWIMDHLNHNMIPMDRLMKLQR